MKILTFLTLTLILCSTHTDASQVKFVAGDNKDATSVCIAAVTDDTEVLANDLKKLSRRGTALNFRSFVNSLYCNNQYIGNFAKSFGAINASNFLDQYTNSRNKRHQPKVTIIDMENALNTTVREPTIIYVTAN